MTGPVSGSQGGEQPAADSAGRRGAFTAVLTRPAGQSAGLAARLAQDGVETFEFPLIDIAPVEDTAPLRDMLASLERYALVVFVSPNAIDHGLAALGGPWPKGVPVAAIGPGSVAALARHGLAAPAVEVICPAGAEAGHALSRNDGDDAANQRFDSESLWVALEARFGEHGLAGKRVLIVRGDGGREWLAERLRAAGASVETVAAYRRRVPQAGSDAWSRVRALLAGASHAWLVTSSEGLRNLDTMARAQLSAAELAALRHAPLVAPHPRIAETARALGFDTITQSGPGDERIAAALRAISASSRASLDQPASASFSAPLRMTDSNQDSTNPAEHTAFTQPQAGAFVYDEPKRRRGGGALLLWIVVLAVVCATGIGAYALNRKVDRLDARVAARQQALDAQAAELRVKIDQALATVHQIDAQFAQLQGKLADAQTAQQALQKQYEDLARNRDDWTFAEVEQMLSSASEQLQLTGNTQLALFALQSADTRLAALASPQAMLMRRAIAQDIDKLKATPSVDLTGLAIKLDDAISQVDSLPLLGEAHVARPAAASGVPAAAGASAAAAGEPRWKVWWREVSSAVGVELKGLVQVRRIDNADAMLNTPEQGEFIRENVKLRLLSARLALLSRNQTTLKSDLQAADAALGRYFDGGARRVQSVRALVKEVDAGAASVETPNINTSLQAVHNTKSRG